MNNIVRKSLFWAGSFAIIFVLGRGRSFWMLVFWILLWAAFLGLANLIITRWRRGKNVFGKRPAGKKPAQDDPRIDSPRKAFIASLNYQISNLLFLLNPFILVQIAFQIVGAYWERKCGHPILEAEQYQQKADYRLPVAGEWHVFNGGVTRETSHSWRIPSQRFAYDLVKFGENRRSFSGNGRKLTDYFCFDSPILAPADGLVIKARGNLHDAPFVGTFWMDCFTRDIGGNSVLIKHADGEYCLLAHLKRGSVRVKPGDHVKQGQEIGRCGHSGNSSEPHLHFQFQNGKSFYFSSGLPVRFSRFHRRNGSQSDFVQQDYISKKTFIASGP